MTTLEAAWFAGSDIQALARSASFPADEYDGPDCEETVQPPGDLTELACTRRPGHDGRHMCALRGAVAGETAFAVLAAWT